MKTRLLLRYPLVALLLIITITTDAQLQQTHRFEKKQRMNDEYFSIIPLKEDGLALLREQNDYEDGRQLWECLLLDSTLTERKALTLPIEPRYPLIGYEYIDNRLYLLFRMGEHTKNNLELIDIDLAQGVEAKRYEIKPELDFRITHFNKVGSSMILGGYVSNEPALLIYKMQDNQIKVVPGFFQKDNELVDVRVNQNSTFNAVIIDRSTRSERKLIFKTFDEDGKLLLDDVVPIEDDRTLQSSISSTLEREDLMVLGTWGDRTGKQSSGFFTLPVDPFSDQKINYITFGQLEHFTDYMNPKRAARIRQNAKDAAVEGRKPNFTAYVMPYRLQESKEGYLMLAEVYHPASSSNPYFNSPYNNPYAMNPYMYNPFWGYYPGMRMYRPAYGYGNNNRNPDDIKAYASIVVAFDAQGKPKWDQSLSLDEMKKPSLEQVSDYYFGEKNVVILYKKESELKAKTIEIRNGEAKELTEKIKLNEAEDEIRHEREFEDGVKFWYGNSFYAWGYHTVRNVHNKEDRTRDVFYINKVVVK
ncbi:MAG TPA: hypothetical protein VGD40_04215 [Chryseosolibacter sp.]